MIGLFILVVLGIIIEIKFKPRLSYIKSCNRLLVWYNSGGRYSRERDFKIIYEE